MSITAAIAYLPLL